MGLPGVIQKWTYCSIFCVATDFQPRPFLTLLLKNRSLSFIVAFFGTGQVDIVITFTCVDEVLENRVSAEVVEVVWV